MIFSYMKSHTTVKLSHISAVSHQQYHTSTSGHYFFCLHGIFIDRTHNRGDMRTRVTKQKLSGRLLKNVVENSCDTKNTGNMISKKKGQTWWARSLMQEWWTRHNQYPSSTQSFDIRDGTDYMNAVLAAWFWAPSKSMHGACVRRSAPGCWNTEPTQGT